MGSKRVLITGISTYWGGRLAQALEEFPEIEAIIGVDSEEPKVELERTEYVKVGQQHALLRRVVEAAEIDTVVDTRLVVDSALVPAGQAHENNVIGTMNILAACSGPESPVRKVVLKSSTHYYGSEQDDPAFFEETMGRPHPPRTPIERDIVEAEASLGEFAEKNPDATVTILRFANVVGPDVHTSHVDLFRLPALPMILGFDPRYQFVHEDDVFHSLEHAVKFDLPGIYNVAGDGVLALSEVAGLLGKPYAPILPPWGTGIAATGLRALGIRIPAEMMNQLRFGRGVDNRRFKAAGFRYRYTSREAVLKLGEHLRLDPVVRGAQEPYRYEREVEEFLRWSPHVRGSRERPALSREQLVELQRLLSSFAETAEIDGLEPDEPAGRAAAAEARAEAAEEIARAAADQAAASERRAAEAERIAEAAAAEAAREAEAEAERRAEAAERPEPAPQPPPEPVPESRPVPEPPVPQPPVDHYDDLESEEVIAILGSLERPDLEALLEWERGHRARGGVISAIESVLARGGSPV